MDKSKKEVDKVKQREPKIRHGDQFKQGICCPSFPVPLRNRVFQHFGYTYTPGKSKQPIAFWILVERLLTAAEKSEKVT